MASSEAVPWSKTGGLADVSTSLAKTLAANGHDVTLAIPYHQNTPFARANPDSVHDTGVRLSIPIGDYEIEGKVCWANVPESRVRLILIEQPDYFARRGLYNEAGGDYHDNLERFTYFCRAVLEVAEKLVLRPDIIHANDWQTGLLPALLKIERLGTPGFERTRSIITIHNLAFQGWFPSRGMETMNLDWKYFNWEQIEFHDQVNLLKTGLVFADQITTVSPTYASEIQTPEFGCSLHELLADRQEKLTGILNGIDPDEWSPKRDVLLPCNFTVDDVATGKPKCKTHLQEKMQLPVRDNVPVFGMVSRLTDQKGLDLIMEDVRSLLDEDVQFVFLGSGDERYEWMISELASRFPDKVAARIGFDEQLAHEIEAGADFYLMPSRFEPCGLNQMYSLAYGTIPLVRRVGGLADSVVDAAESNISHQRATGIVFEEYSAEAFGVAFRRCVALYQDSEAFQQVRQTAMRQDFSWQKSATEYEAVYRRALSSEVVCV